MIDRCVVATSVAVDEAMLTRLVHTGLSTRDLAAVLSVIDPTGRGEWYDRVVESKRRVQAQAPDK